MRKDLLQRLQMLVVALVSMMTLSSCIVTVNEPDFPDTGYDYDLTGLWELSHINGHRVVGYEVNWLEFYGDGWGTYYYNYGPSTYEMPFEYCCEFTHDNWLFINYSDGTHAEMVYWFNHNYTQLILQWYDRGERITYTYQWADSGYWAPSALKHDVTRSGDLNFGFRPGVISAESK